MRASRPDGQIYEVSSTPADLKEYPSTRASIRQTGDLVNSMFAIAGRLQ